MKLIFLDIDGVLNNYLDADQCIEVLASGSLQKGASFSGKRYKREKHFLNKNLIENLNYMVKYTGADLVVSSTWRLGESVESMQALFDSVGIEGKVVGLTENSTHRIRGVEILNYIKSIEDDLGVHYCDYSDYVILDDDSDMLIWQQDNFVHVDGKEGLSRKYMWKAINILGGCNEP